MPSKLSLVVLVLAASTALAQVDAHFETKIILRSSFGFAFQEASYQAAREADAAVRAAMNHDVMGVGMPVALAAEALKTLRQKAAHVRLNPAGKLLLCLNMAQPWGRRPPSIDCVENPKAKGELLALLEVPAGGLSLERDREPEKLKLAIAQALRKPCTDLRTLACEVAAVATYAFPRELDERAFEARVRSQALYKSGDAVAALKNGLELARTMYWLSDSVADAVGQGLFLGHNLYPLYRRALPRGRQALCWLIFLSQREAGLAQLSQRGWGAARSADPQMDADEWYDPVFQLPAGMSLARTPPVLRTMAEQDGCEAQVALVLARLFAGDTYSSRPVRDAIKAGASSLSAVLRELEKAEAEKKRKPFVRWTAGRRTLGAYVDEGRARALVADRIANRTSMHQYGTALTKLITGADPSPRVVAADLKQALASGRFAEPSERIRNLIDVYGHPSAHLLRERYRTSHELGHYIAQLTDPARRSADALASLQETNDALGHPKWWEELALHTGLTEGKEIRQIVTTLRPPPHHDVVFHGGLASATVKFGVASLLVHHVLHQDYGFMKCDLPFGEKVKRLAITLGHFHLTPGTVAKVAISSAIYAVVMGVGSRVVPALTAVALFEYVAYPALERWHERSILENTREQYRPGIKFWMDVYADRDCETGRPSWVTMLPRDKMHVFGTGAYGPAGTPADRRLVLQSVMGSTKVEELETYDCERGVVKTRREVLAHGWFGHWVDVHNKELNRRLHELEEFVRETMAPVQELEAKLAHARNPFRGITRTPQEFEREGGLLRGDQWMMAVWRFAVDDDGNVRRPEEVADRMVQVLVSSPGLASRRGAVEIENGASLNAAHANWLRRVQEMYAGKTVEDIQEKHRDNLARLDAELRELRDEEFRVHRDALRALRDEGIDRVRRVHEWVATELADLRSFGLDRVEHVHAQTGEPLDPKVRTVIRSVIDRRDHLAKAAPALQKIVEGWTRDGAFDPERRARAGEPAE